MIDWAKGQARFARSLTRWAALPYHAVRRRPPGVVVLLYHRVGGGTRSDIDLPVHTFERHMRYLRRHCRVMSLDEVVRAHAEHTLRAAAHDVVVITFDDGYRELYEFAFPVLRRHGLPATIYVPTMYVEEQRPFDFGGFRHLAAGRRPRPLSWEQLSEMVRSGLVTVGSHTHTHADLCRTSPEETGRELDESDALIERRLGGRPRHFAYPWGVGSPAIRQAIGARYDSAALGGPGKNPYADLEPSQLRRYPVLRTDGFWLFRARFSLLPPSPVPDGRGRSGERLGVVREEPDHV